ncbi:MAG: hypothetical protein E7434_07640 [Ruminococcaceae bacterium]|nr:hypothetical protein [Oscillospiraceae bacterium]
MNLKHAAPRKKKWPLYCFYAAVAMLLLAGVLYLVFCQNINSEFGHNEEYFGEQFDELYALSGIDEDVFSPILAQGLSALQTIGTQEEISAHGVFSRYGVDLSSYPEAHSVSAKAEALAASIDGNSGYIWVAYVQEVYDAQGELVSASGNEDARILSRWSVEKLDGAWTVTEIKEKP